MAHIYEMVLASIIYYIWMEHNRRMLQQTMRMLISNIIREIYGRTSQKGITKKLNSLNMVPLCSFDRLAEKCKDGA